MSLIKLFLAGNSSGISGFPEIFRSESGKNSPKGRLKYSRGREKSYPKAEVFLMGKCLISDISGFPAGDADHSLTFLTVYVLKGLGGGTSLFPS
jgi:hypothetical protein